VRAGAGKITTGLAAAILAAAFLPASAPAASSARKVFKGSVPGFAHARPARAAHGRVDIAVAMRWRHERELNALDRSVSEPSSSAFRDFISPTDFRARYSPSAARVAGVSGYLRSQGLRVTRVSDSRMLIDATGSVRAAERAFDTRLASYRVNGHLRRGTAKAVSLPRSVARGVTGVVGLNETVYHRLSQPAAPPPPVFRNAGPCSHYWGERFSSGAIPRAYRHAQPFAPCGYDAQDLQSAYGVDTALQNGYDGSGETVAIIDAFAAPTIVQDVNEYSSRHGLPPANISQTVLAGTCRFGCKGAQGWYGEETLDLEAVHSMAPGAAISYYGAVDSSSKSLLDALGAVIDDNDAGAVTNSYGSLGEGDTRASIRAQEDAAKEAIAQGIGVYFSSGDDGDEHTTIGYVSADYPASSPRVTAVGGTSLGVGPTGGRSLEIGWGTKRTALAGKPGSPNAHWAPAPPGPFLYGSGGGTSRLFREPDYQKHVVPHKLASKFGGLNRVVPDLSMDGDPTTGMLVGETQTNLNGNVKYGEYRIGGTSLSSPLLAGYVTDATEEAGSRIGFINPMIYALADDPSIRDVRSPRSQIAAIRNDFNNGANGADGTTISLRSFNFDTSLHTTPGYDNVTGLGVPGAKASLMDALAGN
jgi:subtilase family serine protease